MLLPNQPSWQISPDKIVQSQFISTRKAKIFKISIYLTYSKKVNQLVITRKPKMCNFVEYKDYKIVYKRYASLYFITIVDKD